MHRPKNRRARLHHIGQRPLTAAETLEHRQLLAADPIVVDTPFDLVDAADGVTSLREALVLADQDSDHDTIEFAQSLEFSMIHRGVAGFDDNGRGILTGAGAFVISSDVTIDGSSAGFVRIGAERGVNIDARVFEIQRGATAEIVNSIVQGGYLSVVGFDPNVKTKIGGAGIRNAGDLTLRGSVVGSNTTYSWGLSHYNPIGLGGGIYNSGTLTLENTHVGEIVIDATFLDDIGVDPVSFVQRHTQDEQLETETLRQATRADHPLADNGNATPTRLGGNVNDGHGAGIYNAGTLFVTQDSVVDGNRALLDGGGIYNSGTATIRDSVVRNHAVETLGSRGGGRGAGVFNNGTLKIITSTVEDNDAWVGGGVYNDGTMSISETTLQGNQGRYFDYPGAGAAIYDTGLSTRIDRSSLMNNASSAGGAIYNASNPNFEINSSTIAHNIAQGQDHAPGASGLGGGIYTGPAASTTVRHSTIARNEARNSFGNTRRGSGGGIYGAVTLRDSVVAENIAESGADHRSGKLTDLGGNVLGSTLARIGELGYYGGTTQTMSVLPGSSATRANGAVENYDFARNEGLSLTSPEIAPDNYSIEMYFRWNSDSLAEGYRKIIDFSDLESDEGLYTNGQQLEFYGYEDSGGTLLPRTFHHLVFTRDGATGDIAGYVDGQKVLAANDAAGLAIFSTPDRLIRLFQDDNTTNQGEADDGSVDVVRLYADPISDNEAAILAARALGTPAPVGTLATRLIHDYPLNESFEDVLRGPSIEPLATDQRGQPRGIGSGSDAGAYEFQPPTSMRVDTLDGKSDGYFVQGQMSLADAVDWANAVPGHDTISLSADFARQLREDAAQGGEAVISLYETLTITDDLTIYGPGADVLSVSGLMRVNENPNQPCEVKQIRVFDIAPGATVEIVGITIQDGRVVDEAGGGIRNAGHLTIRDVVLTNNRADGTPPDERPDGGAIFNDGVLEVISSTIHGNEATSNGGGIYNHVGSQLNVVNSTITDNMARFGGAIYQTQATTNINHATIAHNRATFTGGGIRTHNSSLRIGNSIIAENVAADGTDDVADNNSLNVISQGHNLVGVELGVAGFNQPTDIVGEDPKLGKQRNLGGGTPVVGLLPGSPAIGAGNANAAITVDQRGVSRPIGALPDIGAFEYEAPDLGTLSELYERGQNTIVVDSLLGESDGYFAAGEMSLGEAILLANDPNHPEIDAIELDQRLFEAADGSYTQMQIDAALERFVITEDLTLIGPGADQLKITGSTEQAPFSSVFTIEPSVEFRLSGLTIADNFAERGGGILNRGTLFGDQLYVAGNLSTDGGGIANDGVLVLTNSTLAHNDAGPRQEYEDDGLGVPHGGGLSNYGQAFLANTTISDNFAYEHGAGIYNADGATTALTLTHVTMTQNFGRLAGGLYNGDRATIEIANSILAENRTQRGDSPEGFNHGSVISNGGNVLSDAARLLPNGMHAQDHLLLPDQPLGLGDLHRVRDYPVSVHPVLPGSLLVNQGISLDSVSRDQRGFTRVAENGRVDAGAFELESFTCAVVALEVPSDCAAVESRPEDVQLLVSELSDELDGEYTPGRLTLREAILWGEAMADNQYTIGFADALLPKLETDSVVLNGTPLEITQDVTVKNTLGTSFRISADSKSRVLRIHEGATVEIVGLTFADGRSSGHGGGIYNEGDLTLRNVTVENGNAGTSEAAANGGGIYNHHGALHIIGSTIRSNSAEGSSLGGGVFSQLEGQLAISESTFHGNSAYRGGAIHYVGSGEIDNSVIYRNTANIGGGLQFNGLISNTTISHNDATTDGGGVFTTDLDLYHVTIVDNNAYSLRGGGVFSDGQLDVYNSIIAQNNSTLQIRLRKLRGPILTTDDCNLFGGVQTSEFSLYSILPASLPTAGTNLIGRPNLGPLGDHGGPTWTRALQPGSPAIDAGSNTAKPDSVTSMRLTDQRGRPLSIIDPAIKANSLATDFADIGAYEIQSITSSNWRYEALGASQFTEGDAAILGFGFDDGRSDSSQSADPYFLGFEFDTGKRTYGGIATDPVFGTRWGGTATVDFSGKLGFDVGFYVNSGSVDVTYDGAVDYVIDAGQGSADISALVKVQDGGLYTVSPKVGAYADLVVKLDADVEVTGCVVGCATADLIDIHVGHTEEMFAMNRHMEDDHGNPLFFINDGEENDVPVAKRANGQYYRVDNGTLVTPRPTNASPILDGDIRYFSLPIEQIANGISKAKKTVQEKLAERRAASEVSDAENDFQSASNRVSQLKSELDKEIKTMRNPPGGTAAEVLQAKRRIAELAGKEYADAAFAGTESNATVKGQISRAEDASHDRKNQRDKAKQKYDRNEALKKSKQKQRSPKAGVGIAISEAEGNLLGAQVDLEVGASAGFLNVSKNIGSLQVTLPDVNLRDTTASNGGRLSATTDSYALGSELDDKRQIAKAQVDLAALIPVFPGGKYNLSAGPLSLDVTTVSYNIGPQLKVNQDVSAIPITNTLTYEFFDQAKDVYETTDDGLQVLVQEASTSICVAVTVDGLPPTNVNDEGCSEEGTVRSVTFLKESRINVTTQGIFDGAVRVQPLLNVAARFSNDIGLDVDLDGVFEAFALQLSAFGVSVIDIGPLIKHKHTLATFDLGSVFDETWNLPAANVPLASFTLFDQVADGRTAATALSTKLFDNSNIPQSPTISMQNAPTAVWVTSEMIEAASDPQASDQLYSELTVGVTATDGHAVLDELVVIDPHLSVEEQSNGTYLIRGFTPERFTEQSSALFALTFSSVHEGTNISVTTQRSAPITVVTETNSNDDKNLIDADDFERISVSAGLNLDIDQDGIASPLTDGVLLMRHLNQVSGAAILDGVVDFDRIMQQTGESRAEIEARLPGEIADYIENVLRKTLVDQDEPNSVRESLDLDRSGGAANVTDGELFARYIAGFSDVSLTNGLYDSTNVPSCMAVGEDGIRLEAELHECVVPFLEADRIGATDVTAIGDEINLTGDDVLGLSAANNITNDAVVGSSTSAAAIPEVRTGVTPMGPDNGGASTPASVRYEFELTEFGKPVTFEELYLDGDSRPISRVAAGSPLNFGTASYRHLINTGVGEDRLRKQTGTAALGIEEPMFVRAPDAAVQDYSTTDDFAFHKIVIDPQAGGNLLLPSKFDLYLPINNRWEFIATISPAEHQSNVNGFLEYTFPDGAPIQRFRLISHALPNRELFSAENSVAGEQAAQLTTTIGFLFADGTGVPTVTMTPVDKRELFSRPDAIVVPPADAGTSDATNEIRLVRDTANLMTSLNGVSQPSFQMNGAELLEIFGSDNARDTLVLNSAGGPIHTPLLFDAGFRDDLLLIDPSNGANVTIDLVERDSLYGVETIDIRGTGPNQLVLDADSILSNDPFTKRLVVLADDDDAVELDAHWTKVDTRDEMDVFTQGLATLFISSTANATPALLTPSPGVPDMITPPKPKSTFSHPPVQITPAERRDVAAQDVAPNQQWINAESHITAVLGEAIAIPVDYAVAANAPTTGLHLRMHFDSTQLTFQSIASHFSNELDAAQILEDGPCNELVNGIARDCVGLDGDAKTDRYINLLWLDANGNWSPSNDLFTANFVVHGDAAGTYINFTGNASANYTLTTHPIDVSFSTGDVNNDGKVDAVDIDLIAAAANENSTLQAYDLDRDGSVTLNDRQYLIEQIIGTSAGDSNLDGIFDSGDFVEVFIAGKYEDGIPQNANWKEGDWNGDGDFDSFDFVLAFQRGNYVAAAVADELAELLVDG